MRIDLCRACGSEMKEYERCGDCRKPVSFACDNCKNVTDIQYHASCRYSLLIIY